MTYQAGIRQILYCGALYVISVGISFLPPLLVMMVMS